MKNLPGYCVVLLLLVIPAVAQIDIYDNGPTNGTTDAWTINFGFAVSDSFTIGSDNTPLAGLVFAAWLAPGDVLQSAEVSITSQEFGGTTFFDQTVSFSQSGCVSNQYGFNVCNETGNISTNLNAGTYWLNLQNAQVNTGDPVYWDENSGPSSASENQLGTIPSESFTLLGGNLTCGTGCSTTQIPEPTNIMLFGSAILGVAGRLLRRQ